jgi:hypothetical protein
MNREDEMIELLRELVRWTRVTSIPSVKKLLENTLHNPEERTAYQACDGRAITPKVEP